MLKITSRDNPRVKQAKKVRDGLIKNLIFIEGIRLAREVLRSNLTIRDIFITESFSRTEQGQAFLQNHDDFPPIEVQEKIFDFLSDTKNSQGIIVICEKPATNKFFIENKLELLQSLPIVILLHGINNPSNLGAILRTGEAVNVAGIILTKNSTDAFSPKALRGAMGASFRLPIWTDADFVEALDWAKQHAIISICADVNASKSYLEIDWKKPRLLIFGSEGHGLSAEERRTVNEQLIIPMENGVESLNLAVSCGVILFEAKRQQT